MTVVAIVQARMTSSRLPGKVLLEAAGKPMLAHQLERLGRARSVDRIVVATTANADDDPVAELATRLGVGLHRGSEHDVLDRFHGALAAAGGSVAVRLTGDCPLTDPAVVDLVVDAFRTADPAVAYASNSFPRSWPVGLDVEVAARAALDEAAAEATDPYDREHVMPFLYRQPGRFRTLSVRCPVPMAHHRWTLDEAGDYALLRRIIETLLPDRPDFGWRAVVDLLAAHPDWTALNAAVGQKTRRYEAEAAANPGRTG